MMPEVNSLSHWISRRKGTTGRLSAGACLTVGVLCVVVSGCGTPFQAREQISLTAPLPAEKLLVRTDFGDITVRSDADATEIRAEATLIGKGSTPSEADKALREI